MTLGTRIRKLRTRQRLTLARVASACGVTTSLLSKIENDKALPSVATLTGVAAALGAPVSALLDESKGKMTVLTPAGNESASWTKTDKGYRFRALCADRVEKMMQPLLFVAEKGKLQSGTMKHGGEEFIYVLEGRMNYSVGKITHELGPGDSLYFDAEEPHDLQPITSRVKYLAIFTNPPMPISPRPGVVNAARRKSAAPRG